MPAAPRVPWSPLAGLALVGVALAACGGGGGGGACLKDLAPCDTVLYQPTFDDVFTHTFQPKCALSGGGCHDMAGRPNGLELDQEDLAYALLLGRQDGRARVVPGNPACSILMERLEGLLPVMPPGQPNPPDRATLPPTERCSIQTWIQNGAER